MIRRVLAAAGIVALLGFVAPAAHGDDDVYTTPGGQEANGRLWSTSCEEYSSTVVRCRTNIWGTTVTQVGGRFVQRTGWQFNNLTYLPSTRTQWAGNPLAAGGELRGTATWTSDEGRKWRTECDTATTGRGGCRSYIWASYVKAGGGYQWDEGWVFNNLARFAEGAVRPVTDIPPTVLERAVLTPSGLGPLRFGAAMEDLEKLGYVNYFRDPEAPERCAAYHPSEELTALGIDLYGRAVPGARLDHYVELSTPAIATDKGVRVGMTLDEAQQRHGGTLTALTTPGWYTAGNVGGRQLIFSVSAGKITLIEARPASDTGVPRLPILCS